MIHQTQTLDTIDRSNERIKLDFYDKFIIGLSLFSLLLGLVFLLVRLIYSTQIDFPSITITVGLLMMLIAKKAYFDYHEYDIGLLKISLNSDFIQVTSNNLETNKTIKLEDIEYLNIIYRGFDEGPRNPIFSPKAKRGNRNMISIKDNSGYLFEAEFYLKNKRDAMTLRNNLQYYRDHGIRDKES